MPSLSEFIESASKDTVTLIRKHLPLVRAFLKFHDWTQRSIGQALLRGDLYTAAMHSQLYLLAISEGPLRWILWAVRNVGNPRVPPMLGNLIRDKLDNNDPLPENFKDTLYGTSLKEKLLSSLNTTRLNLGDLTEAQLNSAKQMESTIESLEQFGLSELRNSLAHQQFYITEDGTIWWRRREEAIGWSALPIEGLLTYIGDISPHIMSGLIELIDNLELKKK